MRLFRKSSRSAWSFSLFIQMLILFTLITVPLLTASFWLNKKAEQNTREQVLALTWEQMEGAIGRLDEQIMTLTSLGQYICSNSTELDMLTNMPEALTVFEKGEMIRRIQQQFTQIKLAASVIRDVRVHIKSLGRTISTFSLSTSLEQDEYDFIMERPLSANTIVPYGDKLILFFTSGINMDYEVGTKDSSFFLVIEFSKEHLLQYVEQSGGDDESNSLLFSEDGSYQFSGQPDGIMDQIFEDAMQPGFTQDILTVNGTDYIVLKQQSSQTGLMWIKYIDIGVNYSVFDMYRTWLWIFVLLFLLAVGVYTMFVYHKIRKPMNGLIDAFRKVEQGDFNVSVHYEKNDEFRYLYHRFDRMVENTRNLIEQVYEQKILSQRAELKQLQSQINPHFLYNSLFIISVMSRQGKTKFVEEFAGELGRYFQFIVKNPAELIPLEEEVAHARSYMNIQMTRFSNRIQMTMEEVPKRYARYPVPRLIIQPLIENALSYSLEKKNAGGVLKVYFQEETDALAIYVEDNGGQMTQEQLEAMRERIYEGNSQEQMSGMFNIHRRLVIQYGSGSGLELATLPDGGLQVKMKLVFEREKQNVPFTVD